MAGFGSLGFPLKIAGNPGVFLAVSVGAQWETRGKNRRQGLGKKGFPQKKVLSLVLCVAMLLSVMVMGTGAAFTDQDEIQNAEAVDMATALGIIDGYEDGSFQPAENIERGEAAKMISAMLNGGRDSVQEITTSHYTDVLSSVDAWANKYIEYCTAETIVSGVGGDRFAPASDVTGTQLAKMLLVSLGYDPVKEGYQDTGAVWALNVNTDALAAGLYAGIETVDMNAPLSRDNAAQMIWNALNANTVIYLTSSTGALQERGDLLGEVYGATVTSGIMTEISNYNRDTGVYTYVIEPADSSGQIIADADDIVVESTVDYSDLFAMNVTVVRDRDGRDALNIWADADNVIVEAVWGDVDNYNVGDTTITIDGTQYRIDNNPNTNNLLRCAFNDYNNGNPGIREQYAFRAIDTDNGGDIDTIVLYPYTVLKVEDVDNDSFTAGAIGADDAKLFVSQNRIPTAGHWVDLAGTRNFVDVQIQGDLEGAEYVMAIPAAHTAQLLDTYVVLDVQTATPSQLSDVDELVTMNDTEYDGALLTNSINTNPESYNVLADISLKHSYNYVSVNDYLFVMDGAGVQAPLNYAVVTDRGNGTTGTTADLYQTDLLLTTGETITVNATSQVDVGNMVTYTVNNAGNYVLTDVDDATYTGNTSIYTAQEAYEAGANLSGDRATSAAALGWGAWDETSVIDGNRDRYGKDRSGDYFLPKDENSTEKYYIDEDAVIFVYYYDAEDGYYDVISGAELAAADLAEENVDIVAPDEPDVCWAFSAIDKQDMVQMGYIAISHDIDEVTYEAYIDGAPTRTMVDDETGDYYVKVNVMLPGGEMKTLESALCENEDDTLIRELYAVGEGGIYSVTLLNDKVVHVGNEISVTALTVTDAYNEKTKTFVAEDSKGTSATYLVTDDTNIYSLLGKPLTAINAGDPVWVVAEAAGADGLRELLTLVYDD